MCRPDFCCPAFMERVRHKEKTLLAEKPVDAKKRRREKGGGGGGGGGGVSSSKSLGVST